MAQYDFTDPPMAQGHEDFDQVMVLPTRHRALTPLCIPIVIRCTAKSIDTYRSAGYQVVLTIDAVDGKWTNAADTKKHIVHDVFESFQAHTLAWHPEEYYYFVFEQPCTLKHIEFKQVEKETDFFLRAVLKEPDSEKVLQACSFNLTIYPKVKGSIMRDPIVAKDMKHNQEIVDEIESLCGMKLTLK